MQFNYCTSSWYIGLKYAGFWLLFINIVCIEDTVILDCPAMDWRVRSLWMQLGINSKTCGIKLKLIAFILKYFS